jgi:two-component system, chemotaxis family, chemotaxis protein CheY
MGKTIMTADDSASIRQMVSFTLKEAGYDVIEAVDGRDALEKLMGECDSPLPGECDSPLPEPGRTGTVHMLVTDLNMPNMDGIELIRRVRGESRYRFMPIVMLTTESQNAKKQEGKAAGATGWIVKPFKPEQLVAVVRKVLG